MSTQAQRDKALELIQKNRDMEFDGGEPVELFYSQHYAIHDPYVDTSGRFEVDPVEFYGADYTKWLESL